jgi:hypothetical protein
MVSSVEGLPVPLHLVRQVPPQRREVASEAVTGVWGVSRPSTLRRTSRQASRRTSHSLNYTRHLLHAAEIS